MKKIYQLALALAFIASCPFNGFSQTANFTFNGGCKAQPTNFTDTSIPGTATISQWQWDFGDSFTDNVPNPMHVFADTGLFNVQLIITDTNAVVDTFIMAIQIADCPASLADFGWNGCSPGPIMFNAFTMPPLASIYAWDFGDGGTDNIQNPNHSYAMDGVYNVMLVVTDSNSMVDTMIMAVNVGPCSGGGAAAWGWNGCYPDTIFFHGDADPLTISSYNWTFGDGGVDSVQNSAHLYTAPGNYEVWLYVVDTASIPDSMQMFVQVDSLMCVPPSLADFNWNGCTPGPIMFNALTMPPLASTYQWDFGDGASDNIQNPNHTYAADGAYNVQLIVMDSVGTIDSMNIVVNVGPCGGQQLSVWSYNGCWPDTIFFHAEGDPQLIQTYAWDFGDGSTAATMDVDHVYTNAGFFTVQLAIQDTNGVLDTSIMQIQIDSNMCPPPSNFWWDGCYPGPTNFHTSQDSGIINYSWNFGDGGTDSLPEPSHQYADTGMYNVTLIVDHGQGALDTMIFMVGIYDCGPVAPLSQWWYDGCWPDTLFFHSDGNPMEISSYAWDFGDGNTSTLDHPAHVYASEGDYNVQLVITDTIGGTDTMMMMVGAHPNCPGPSDFWWDGCFPGPLNFHSNLDPQILTYAWNFGDGNIDNIAEPIHAYTDTGMYMVSLIITDSLGNADTTYKMVDVFECSGLAEFGFVACAPDTAWFWSGSDIGAIQSFVWDFGDGSATAGGSNPGHLFADTGMFNITLIATDTLGGIDTNMMMIGYYPCSSPVYIDYGNDCIGDTTFFFTNYDLPYSPVTWAWDLGDGTSSTLEFPDVMYADTGMYNIMLVVTDGGAMSDTGWTSIDIRECSYTEFDGDGHCVNDSTFFWDVSTHPNISDWNWDFGDGNTASGQNVAHVYAAAGTYEVTMIITDGTNSDTLMHIVEIYEITLSVTTTDATCFGGNDGTATAIAGSNGPAMYQWDNGDNSATINNLEEGVVSVEVSDSTGCMAWTSVYVGEATMINIQSTMLDASCGQADGDASVTASGGTAPYTYEWNNSVTGSSISSVVAGTYFVSVDDALGCQQVTSMVLIDQDGPTSSITSTTDANCGGPDGEILTSTTGGTLPYSYNWSSGETTPNLFDIEPGVYSLQVTDDNGCVGGASATINSNGNSPPSISGHVESSLNGFSINAGTVTLIRDNGTGTMDIIATADIDSSGNYNFEGVLPIGPYLVLAQADSNLFQYAIPTFFESTHRWDSATVIYTDCDTDLVADISVIDLTPLSGTSTLGGVIIATGGNKFGVAVGDPVPGVDLALEQVPGGIVAGTKTGVDGYYEFRNVPMGDYRIFVNIPGLEMEETYDIVLTSNDSTSNELDFLVGDSSIFIEESTGIEQVFSADENAFKVYPNPFKDYVNVEYMLKTDSDISIEIFNIIGSKVYSMSDQSRPAGSYLLRFDGKDIGAESGIYIIKMNIDGRIQTSRIIQTQ